MLGGIIGSASVNALGWTLLHSSWQVAIIYVCHLLLQRLLARHSAHARYVAACSMLIAAVAIPAATFSGLHWNVIDAGTLNVPIVRAKLYSLPRVDVTSVWAKAGALLQPLLPSLSVLWASVVLIRLLLTWKAMGSVRSLVEAGRPVDLRDLPRWKTLVERLTPRHDVRLLEAASITSPATVGWLRPVVLIPVGLLSGLPMAQVEHILAHELAHIRRRDYLVNLIQSLAETLLCYHPGAWLLSRDIAFLREACCDDLAMRSTGAGLRTYGEALRAAATFTPAPGLAMAVSGGSLTDRVRRLVALQRHPPKRGGARLVACLFVLLLAVGAGGEAVGGQLVRQRDAVRGAAGELSVLVYELLDAKRDNPNFLPAVEDAVASYRLKKSLTFDECLRFADRISPGAEPDALLRRTLGMTGAKGLALVSSDGWRGGEVRQWQSIARELLRHRNLTNDRAQKARLTRACLLVSAQSSVLPGIGVLQRIACDPDRESLDAVVPGAATRLAVMISARVNTDTQQRKLLDAWIAAAVNGSVRAAPTANWPTPGLQWHLAYELLRAEPDAQRLQDAIAILQKDGRYAICVQLLQNTAK